MNDHYDDRPPRRYPERSNAMATVSMALGFMSFFCALFAGIPAIACGVLGLKRAQRSGIGQVQAIVGIVCGMIGTVFATAFFVLFALGFRQGFLSAVNAQSTAVAKNDLKQLAAAMINYSSTEQRLPAEAILSADGKPLLSWRVELLPHLNEGAIYQQFHRDEPWDSPHNRTLISRMPSVFADPRLDDIPGQCQRGETYVKVFTGTGTIFDGKPRMPHRIKDGSSNTILIAAGGSPVPWTKPDDIPYDPQKPLPDLLGPFDIWLVATADGSVHSFDIGGMPDKDARIRPLITIADGKFVKFDD